MFSANIALMALAAAGVSALENTNGTERGIPVDSMISYDGIYLGIAPDYSPPVTWSNWTGYTGQKPATWNIYAQIDGSSGSYDDSNYQFDVSGINNDKAVLIASLMPSISAGTSSWSQIDSGMCSSVANFFTEKFTSQGTTVWLRYAHEVNYYVTDGTYPSESTTADTQAAYLQSWECMYNAVKGNDKILMYWSPNSADASDLEGWFPGRDQVDIVGIDIYPDITENGGSVPGFADVYSNFYDNFAAKYQLPFAIGETGITYNKQLNDASGNASPEQRQEWLKNIINSGIHADFPWYFSATWFEYGPTGQPFTYYIVQDQSEAIIQQTISNTEVGSA